MKEEANMLVRAANRESSKQGKYEKCPLLMENVNEEMSHVSNILLS